MCREGRRMRQTEPGRRMPTGHPRKTCLSGRSWRDHAVTESKLRGFPGGPMVKNPPANAKDAGSDPGSGRCPGEGNGNPLQGSCLEKPTDRGAWWATVHGVAESRLNTQADTQEQTEHAAVGGSVRGALLQEVIWESVARGLRIYLPSDLATPFLGTHQREITSV